LFKSQYKINGSSRFFVGWWTDRRNR